MRTTMFSIALLIAPALVNAQEAWRTFSTGTTAGVSSIQFVNDTLGFFGAGGKWRTTNGGLTWSQIAPPTGVPLNAGFSDVQIVSGSDMLMLAYSTCGSHTCDQTWLLRSTDAGATWRDVPMPTGFSTMYYSGLDFPTETTGYMSLVNNGQSADRETLIARSTDAGVTWTRTNLPYEAGLDSLIRVNRPVFTSADHGFVTGSRLVFEGRSLYETFDGGGFWNKVNTGFTDVVSIRPLDDYTWLILSGATVARTSDGGATWRTVLTTGWTSATAMDFDRDGRVGYLVGRRATTDGPTEAYKTNDRGLTWRLLTLPGEHEWLRSVSVLNADTVFMGGDSGTVFMTTTGGEVPSFADDQREQSGVRISTSGDVARIEFAPLALPRRLTFFDALGRVVHRTIVPVHASATTVSLSQLSRGTYWCMIGERGYRMVVTR